MKKSNAFETFFIDLDDTVYDSRSGLWPAIKQRIQLYMVEVIGLDPEEASVIRQKYLKQYGTTLKGLIAEFGVKKMDYLSFVHDLPLGDYLKPDPELRSVLQSFPQRKIILTSADAPHAERVLSTLGLRDCFEQIVDIHVIEPFCKPAPEAFKRAMEVVNAPQAHKCIMVDDLAQNLIGAQSVGMFGIHVSSNSQENHCNAVISNLRDLRKAFQDQ